jgi:hypothetical protein
LRRGRSSRRGGGGRGWPLVFLIPALLLLGGAVLGLDELRVIDDFEQGLAPGWEEKSFSGQTRYRVVADGDNQVLEAAAAGTASGLMYPIDYVLADYPVLSWRWRVNRVLDRGNALTKDGDDYPARVYVVFPHWFWPRTRSINYIWANRLPRETVLPNPYTSNAMMVAVEGGPNKVGQWVVERRNVLEDYRRIFGEEPPPVGAIAVMTDTDNTGESAIAWYDDIRIERD